MQPEIIQQWQLYGSPPAKLLEGEVLENAQNTGITSLQSYFLWSEIEREEGKFDFSSYDVLVEKLKKHNLKWVPFVILGPSYSTPEWFKKSEKSVFYECIEHNKKSGNQSIWNPNLPRYIERFLAKLAEHYQNQDIFESIILGVAGNWGEAIYPTGGYWVGNYHSHNGFWAGDKYAKESFVKFSLEKYKDIKYVNQAWKTNFFLVGDINFPVIKESKKTLLFNFIINLASKNPDFIKKPLKFALEKITKKSFLLTTKPNSQPQKTQESGEKQRWLDFIDWYLGSMTNWADFWIKTARQYFPEVKIYLVTGGLNGAIMGADFVAQTKVAKKYNAGIRITNQTNDYAQSFIQTRLVSSAARFYNSYFTTEEEAIFPTPEGITMRIFDAITSGANGFYCRNFISIGDLPFIGRGKLPIGQQTDGGRNLKKYINLFDFQKPEIDTAVFFPNTSAAFNYSLITSLYNSCAQLRDVSDFDLVDETMIKDGALQNYKHLLILEGNIPSGEVKAKIEEWLKQGGILTSDPPTISNEIDNEKDGIYATKLADRVLYFNSRNKKIKKNIPFLKKSVDIEPNSIISLPLID